MAKGIGSFAIGMLATASGRQYSTIDRMTRPLIANGRWVHRGRPGMEADFLACALVGLAALLPGDAMEAVAVAENLFCHKVEKDFEAAAARSEGFASDRDSMMFRSAVMGGTQKRPRANSLLEFVRTIIVNASKMAPDARLTVGKRLSDARWNLLYSVDAESCVVSWYSSGFKPNALACLGSEVTEEQLHNMNLRRRYFLSWHPAQGELEPSGADDLVQSAVRIPFKMILVAADIYLAAKGQNEALPLSSSGAPTTGAGIESADASTTEAPAQSDRPIDKAQSKRTHSRPEPSNSSDNASGARVRAMPKSRDGSSLWELSTWSRSDDRHRREAARNHA